MNFKLSAGTLAILLGFLAFVIAAFIVLAVTGHDSAGLTTLLVGLIFPTLASILNLAKSEHTAKKADETAETVKSIEQSTNGANTALMEIVARQSDQLAAAPATDAHPPAAGVDIPAHKGEHEREDPDDQPVPLNR